MLVGRQGYDYPDDPFILRGSCGVEYELLLTESGRRNQQQRQYGSHRQAYADPYASGSAYGGGYAYGGGGSGWGFTGLLSTLFSLFVVGFICYVIAVTCFRMFFADPIPFPTGPGGADGHMPPPPPYPGTGGGWGGGWGGGAAGRARRHAGRRPAAGRQ